MSESIATLENESVDSTEAQTVAVAQVVDDSGRDAAGPSTLSSRDAEFDDPKVSTRFLLRVGGLPIDVVDQLRLGESRAWADRVLELESSLEENSQPLVDALYEEINGLADKALRRRLLKLKRNAFNLRTRVDLESASEVVERLGEPAGWLLAEWIRIHTDLRRELEAGEKIFSEELTAKRALLKQVVQNEDFRKGILLSSELLDRGMGNYLRSKNHKLKRRQRLAERSLYQYLLRTACKTSPFSTFTPVAMGSFVDGEVNGGEEGIEYRADDMEKQSYVRLNLAHLSRLSNWLVAHAEVKRELPVQPVAGWTLKDGRLRYIRRTIRPTELGSGAIVDPMHENVLRLPSGEFMRDLLASMRDGQSEKLGALIQRLASSEGRSEEQVEEYLHHLFRLGFLTLPDLRLDLHSSDPLEDYIAGLRRVGHPLTTTLADRLAQVDQLVKEFAGLSVNERRVQLRRISGLLEECFELVGAPEDGEIDPTLVFEDTTLDPDRLVIGRESWREVNRDLAEIHRLLPIFDFNLPRRLVTKGFFKARFEPGSRCDDFLRFADEFNLDYFDQYVKRSMRRKTLDEDRRFVGLENSLKQPEITALNVARQALADYVQEAYDQQPEGSDELRLDRGRLRAICRDLPRPSPVESHSYFCQFGLENGEPRLVINRAYAGFGLLFSRFARFLAEGPQNQLLPELRRAMADLEPEDAIFAELKGGYDTTNLNLHPPVTRYELVCPGDLSRRPADEQIELEDLAVEHRLEDDSVALVSKRLGKQVIPVYLGYLLPMALPEIQQVLLNFAYLPMCPMAVWTGVDTDSAENERGVASYPRICLGSVVIERAMWKVLPEALPERESEDTDAGYFLKLSRWARENGVPRRVFVTPDADFARGGLGAGNRDAYKPLYVDFDDYFSLLLLEATARGAESRLVMKEMLPERDQLWLRSGGDSYVAEFVLETNRRNQPLG